MTYYEDLSEYAYDPPREPMVNVGWLAPGKGFRVGTVPDDVREVLVELATRYERKMRGYHECGFCALPPSAHPLTMATGNDGRPLSLGMSEIHVTDRNNVIYAAPSLVLHYIDFHSYQPPREFIEAVQFGIPLFHAARDLQSERRAEVRRLVDGSLPGEVPGGHGLVELPLSTESDVQPVLSRVKELLAELVVPDLHDFRRLGDHLPQWFVSACDRWWQSDWAEVVRASSDPNVPTSHVRSLMSEAAWSLEGWWEEMRPDRRSWSWWDVAVVSRNSAIVRVELVGWPVKLGALRWLLRAAGARVEPD